MPKSGSQYFLERFMWVTILIFLIVTFNISCSKSHSMPNGYDRDSIAGITPVRTYLALGDSYTIGQSVPESDRFPNQVKRMLVNYGKTIASPKIIATTGWTTGNLLTYLLSNPPQTNYHVVTLLIGVNNQYQHRSIEEYRIELTRLINLAINYAGDRRSNVFVLSIPDYSITPFARNFDTASIAREIDAFNFANKQIAAQAGVQYIDITPSTRQALYDQSLLAHDSLHPSGREYHKWAEILASKMKETF